MKTSERKGKRMKDIINFFQEIFMIKKEETIFIGLSQFKTSKVPIVPKKPQPKKSDVKLSDLMRRSV